MYPTRPNDTLPLDEPLKLMALTAALCSDLGAHTQALQIFEALADERQRDPNALVSWAVALSRSGDRDAAMTLLHEALGRDPDLATAKVMLAIELHAAGERERANTLLLAVLEAPVGVDVDALALAREVQDELLTRSPRTAALTPAAAPVEPLTSAAVATSRLRYRRASAL